MSTLTFTTREPLKSSKVDISSELIKYYDNKKIIRNYEEVTPNICKLKKYTRFCS